MSPWTVRFVIAAAVVAVTVGLAVAAGVDGKPGIVDTPVYRSYGERIAGGEVPYRDFTVEYPPGALVPFVLPALVTADQDGYDFAFAGLMIFALAALAVLVVTSLVTLGASLGRAAAGVVLVLAGFVALGPFVLSRFDLYVAAFTLAAVAAILHGRDRLGAVLLGVAIATKIYPAVLLPLLVARVWKQQGSRAAMASGGVAVGTALVIFVPFVLVAPEGAARSLWRQIGRPLQIESLASAVLLALHNAAGMPLAWASSSGSQNLTGTVAGIGSVSTTLVGAAALLLVWVRFARGDVGPERFARYAAAAVVAFVAFGKVLSPQFLVWLLPLVALVPGGRGLAAMVLALGACVLTRLWFPDSYWELVKQFDPTASWLVLARDLVLVALFATLLVRFRAREPAPDRSPSPAP